MAWSWPWQTAATPASARRVPPAARVPLLDALADLPDDAFAHVARVCVDIAKRHPDPAFADLGTAAAQVTE